MTAQNSGLEAGLRYERGVRSPLKEADLSKAEIRILARDLDLPVWNKPASACLGSRIPYGVEITSQKLAQVESAEETLYDLGFPHKSCPPPGSSCSNRSTC